MEKFLFIISFIFVLFSIQISICHVNAEEELSIESDEEEFLKLDPALYRKYPDFFIIGERKCATTSLKRLMMHHNELCPVQERQEMHFFDRNIFNRKKIYYYGRFSQCNNQTWANHFTLDGTPSYVRDSQTLDNMIDYYGPEVLKQKKFILIFREPLEAQFSWYTHRLRECSGHMHAYREEKLNQSDASQVLRLKKGLCEHQKCKWVGCHDLTLKRSETIDHHKHLYSFREYVRTEGFIRSEGHYLAHLKAWESRVGRERIFVINFDSLVRNTSSVTSALSSFLGFKQDFGPNVTLPHANGSGQLNVTSDCTTWDALSSYYDKVNANMTDYINSHPNRPVSEPYFPPFHRKRLCA